MEGFEACIRACIGADVRTVFTLMSEDIMALISRIESEWADEITVVNARHEQNAVAMADAYSRATGNVGVCIVGRGPGLAQTGTALTTAGKANSKLFVLAAESALDSQTEEKGFDQRGYLQSTLGEVASIRSDEQLPGRISHALRRVRGGDGPLAVQIPNDILNGELSGVPDDWQPEPWAVSSPVQPEARVHPEPEQIEKAVDKYLNSDATTPPIILAGKGAREADAREALETLAERIGAILVTTLRARNLFHGHPYHAGIVGTLGTNVANGLISESDFVLAVGCSLNDRTTDKGRLFPDNPTVVHVDTDPLSIGQRGLVDVPIVGDARTVVEQFETKLEEMDVSFGDSFWTEQMRRKIADSSGITETSGSDRSDVMHPGVLIENLNELLPDERLVVTDGGHFTMWVLDGIDVEDPDNFVWLYEFLSIGLGFPAGIGAAQSLTEGTETKRCVAFCGDAGFMMALQELDTAVRNELPLTVVVMNDETLGSEYHKLEKRGHPPDSAVIETPPIAEVAEAMGATGETIRSLDVLRGARETIANPPTHPLILDCRTDRDIRHRYYE